MSIPRRLGGIALLQNGSVLVTDGVNSYSTGNMLASTEIYTPTNGTGRSTDNLNSPRFWFGNLVVLNSGKVLVTTGTADPGYNEYYSAQNRTFQGFPDAFLPQIIDFSVHMSYSCTR